MSPYNFNTSNSNANEWNVNSSGYLNNNNVNNTNGVRPVISSKIMWGLFMTGKGINGRSKFITISYDKISTEETSLFLGMYDS